MEYIFSILNWPTDKDECEEAVCDVNAECFNRPGSYICKCKLGFFDQGGGVCGGKQYQE